MMSCGQAMSRREGTCSVTGAEATGRKKRCRTRMLCTTMDRTPRMSLYREDEMIHTIQGLYKDLKSSYKPYKVCTGRMK